MKPPVSHRMLAGVLALAGLFSLASPAFADTKGDISVQEKRMKWLEGLAREKQSKIAAIQSSIRSLSAEIRKSSGTLDRLDRQRRRHENQLIETMARYDDLHRQMSDASAEMYMRGSIDYFMAMMDARTLSDAGDAANYTRAVLSSNRRLAEQTALATREIADLKARDDALIREQAGALRAQQRRQDELVRVFADGQRELEEVAAIRAEVADLLGSLRRQLRAEEMAALGGTMPYGPWAERFLGFIGAPASRGNLVAMVAWQLAEGTMARWNPLATTWRMPGSTQFNGHRVQNYVSLEQGLEATRKTLSRPGHKYEAILASLRAGASAMDTGRAINASNWCRGCADGQYVIELIPVVERYYERYAARRG